MIMKWWPLTFQNQISEKIIAVDWLFDYISILLIFVLILVGGALVSVMFNKFLNLFSKENSLIEIFWTVAPTVSLIFIGLPSLNILYNTESEKNTAVSLKINGHQWYWSYDYSDLENVEFDAFLMPLSSLEKGWFRVLETDNHVILPFKNYINLFITSADVLHSWALPVISLKSDANPGRLNMISCEFDMCGLFYGQCSELCGANHSFMPICVEVTSPSLFYNWLQLWS